MKVTNDVGHGDLRDRDGVGPRVPQGQLDLAGAQDRSLDRELLDRRAAALVEAGAAEQGERRDRDRDQRERDDGEHPHGQRSP